MKKLYIVLAVIVVIIVLAFGGAYIWYNSQLSYKAGGDQTKIFQIETGESSASISERLEKEGYISSANAFQIYLKLNDKGGAIKAGRFLMQPGQDLEQVVDTITQSPPDLTTWVTIREGLRYTEIVDDIISQFKDTDLKLEKTKLIDIITKPEKYLSEFSEDTASFISKYKPQGKSLEGFLYPDTYNLFLDATEIHLVDLLVSTMASKFTPQMLTDIQKQNSNIYKILTISSIVEREANNNVDYPIVSGILYNRLEIGELLGIDATTLYGLGRWTPEPTQSELRDTNNLYNTRAIRGLTPTPISNPGIATIKAAIYPKDTNYLFYITGNDGKMYYAVTYAEHNQNIREHL